MYLVQNRDTGKGRKFKSIEGIKRNCRYDEDYVYLLNNDGTKVYLGEVSEVTATPEQIMDCLAKNAAEEAELEAKGELKSEEELQEMIEEVEANTKRTRPPQRNRPLPTIDSVLDAYSDGEIGKKEMIRQIKEIRHYQQEFDVK